MDAINLNAQVAIDPLDASKRVKRSFGGNDSHVISERELRVVEASDTSSSELGILAWRPESNGFESVSSPKKDEDILSILDAGVNPRKNWNNIFCDRDLHGRVDQVLLDGDSYNAVNSEHLYSEHSHTTKKGKLNLEDDTFNYKQHAVPAIQSSRSFSLFGKEMATIADEDGSCFASYPYLSCRKPHDFKVDTLNHLSHAHPIKYKQKSSSMYLPEWKNGTDTGENDHLCFIRRSPQITAHDHISNPSHDQGFSESVSVNRRNHSWKKNVEGQNKCKSLCSKFGETSGSILKQLSYPQSHAEISKLKLDSSHKNKCRGVTSIEVDKVYSEVSNYLGKQSGFSDKHSATVSQIESDEIFARELQEQFYHETTRFIDIEKVDAKMAWSLQSDEDSKATSLVWIGHSGPMDTSVANLHSPHHSSTLVESGSSMPDHATTLRNRESLERYPEMVLYEKFRRNLNNEVDLETRLELLEAMEDMLETNTDYENNHQHVSSCDVNTLPLSVVQNGNNEEACYVCLDIPSVGETIRHLPCLHRFHKTCIDPWLKDKSLCPVCKLRIN